MFIGGVIGDGILFFVDKVREFVRILFDLFLVVGNCY